MKLYYTVSQDLWDAHQVGYSYDHSAFRTKKYALQNAALASGLPIKKYMEFRKKSVDKQFTI